MESNAPRFSVALRVSAGTSRGQCGPFRRVVFAAAALFSAATALHAQPRPYIGFAYPAGGQTGTTVQIRVGGQDLDEVNAVQFTGEGVTGRVVEFNRRLNNQEVQLLNEQLRELRKTTSAPGAKPANAAGAKGAASVPIDPPKEQLIAKIDQRVKSWVNQPACVSISAIAIVEVNISPEAEPGLREFRLVTPRGVSCPLPFEVGQLPELARKAMPTCPIQTLGKEANALRKRPPAEGEDRVTLPCVLNGQIASGEINSYRFAATKGQRLVFTTLARRLVPFIADAVPGWFQPVLAIYDPQGHEIAYDDDYRFKPDPVIVFDVPQDGEYVLAIHDSLYRGREDFVYRITAGELPFVTSVFPLGRQAGAALLPSMTGVNVSDADLGGVAENAKPGTYSLAAWRVGNISNRVPFEVSALPDAFEREPNNDLATAQAITLPVVVNGRIDRADDTDVFKFTGRAKQPIVIDVHARRLDSPLDSIVRLTDASGKVIAFNDDCEDATAGVNTHEADSYLTTTLPADGTYYVQVRDTARRGGEEYGYRIRISAPQPDFELRVVPSSLGVQLNSTTAFTVYAVRRDGFTGPIKLSLVNLPPGITAVPVTLPANQNNVRFTVKAGPKPTHGPVKLALSGTAKIGDKDVVHAVVAAEDRMQAFLWRQLVPAQDLQLLVFDRNAPPAPARPLPARPAALTDVVATLAATVKPAASAAPSTSGTATSGATTAAAATTTTTTPPKFTKQQIIGRLRQLKLLYEEGLLTDEFYLAKVAECDTSA